MNLHNTWEPISAASSCARHPGRRASGGLAGAMVLAVLLAPAAPPAPEARGGVALSIEQQYGGAATAVALQGDLAFVGMGTRLVILDLVDPAAPRLVGRSAPFSGIVEHIAVADDFVYASGMLGSELELGRVDPRLLPESPPPGLRVLDVRDPRQPVSRGFWPSPAPIKGLAAEQQRVLLALGGAGLSILDVSEPDSPIETGSVGKDGPLSYARDVAVYGGWAYVADPVGRRLVVVGFGDETAPAVAASLTIDLAPITLEMAFPYVLVGTGRAGSASEVAIIDVSRADQPFVASTVAVPPASIVDIAASGTRAYYLADSPYCILDGVHGLDIADPMSPHRLEYSALSPKVAALAVTQNLVVMAAGEMGLRVLDPDSGEIIARIGYAGRVSAVAALPDSTMLLAANGGYSGLDIVSVEDPAAISPVGNWPASGRWPPSINDLDVAGKVAYAAFGQNCLFHRAGLLALDVRDPDSPSVMAEVDLELHSTAVAVDGSFAYVADEDGWLSVVDVSQPMTPTRVGIVDYDALGEQLSELIDVAVADGLAYVVVRGPSGSAVDIIDIEDKHYPHKIARIKPPGQAWSVDSVGRRVFVADARYGVHVWDTSDPSRPRYLGGNTALNAISVAVAGDTVFAVGAAPQFQMDFFEQLPSVRYLWALDALHPSTLPEVGRMWLGDARAVSVLADSLLVAGGHAGIYRVRVAANDGAPTPTPGASRTPAPTETPWLDPGPSHTPTPYPTTSSHQAHLPRLDNGNHSP